MTGMIWQQYGMNNKFRYNKIKVLNIAKEEKIRVLTIPLENNDTARGFLSISSTLRHFDTSTLRHFDTSTLRHKQFRREGVSSRSQAKDFTVLLVWFFRVEKGIIIIIS